MKSLFFTAILSLRILIKFAILLQVRLTHAQTFFRGVLDITFAIQISVMLTHAQTFFRGVGAIELKITGTIPSTGNVKPCPSFHVTKKRGFFKFPKLSKKMH